MLTLAEPCSNNTYTLTVHVVASLSHTKTDANSSILVVLQKEVIHENISQLSYRHIFQSVIQCLPWHFQQKHVHSGTQ